MTFLEAWYLWSSHSNNIHCGKLNISKIIMAYWCLMTGCCFFLFPNKIMRKEKKSSALLPGREGAPGMTQAGCGEETSPWLLLLCWELICVLNVLSGACPKKTRSPHFCRDHRPYSYKAQNMQTDVGISDSIILFMIFICVEKGRSEN